MNRNLSVLLNHHVIFLTLKLTNFHGKVYTQVNILGPDVVGRLGVEHRVDTTVQVSLAGSLTTAGHSDDGGTGPVPRQHVSRPAGDGHKLLHTDTHILDCNSYKLQPSPEINLPQRSQFSHINHCKKENINYSPLYFLALSL